ncbi:thiol reductant ABC exporter subunit CydC [Rhodococcus sp. X156]|uniref:thiol reductant ABC exporter subunit CydC n=1 Tax=Rhodococcus sp. X156 TaxID=2499145 RepID=UPI000FD925FB|nr:thiol reductant ABC exporter subunit CydC [Rhodococcus sp. X156]
MSVPARGPLAPLAGVPGVRAALLRAGLAALGQVVGMVLLAAGLAAALADVARGSQAGGDGPAAMLAVAAAGVGVRALSGFLGDVAVERDARRGEDTLRRRVLDRLLAGEGEAVQAAGGTGPAALLAGTRLHELAPALVTVLPALAQTVVVPPVVLVALLATDWLSGVIVACTLPLVPLFMVLVGWHTRERTTAAALALDRIAEHVAELVRGLPVLVGLGRAADQLAALSRLGQAHRVRTMATLRVAFLSALVLEVIATLSMALVAVSIGLRLVHGEMPLQAGLFALLLAPEAFAPLRALGSAHHASEDAAAAVAAAEEVLTGERARPVVQPGPDLAVQDLRVQRHGRAAPAVDGLSLTVAPGEVLALRGPSGAGKSTVLAVLAGTLRDGPRARVTGSVTVPGEVAVVPQFPRTTAPTVAAELVRHGAHEQDVPALLAEVGAPDLAQRRCRTLSPGELARVALARALVRVHRGASVLLLDEPTASLDPAATAVVQQALARVRHQVRTVLVTHEPTLAALADHVVDLPGLPAAVRVPAAPAGSPGPRPSATPPAHQEPQAAVAATSATFTGQTRWPRRALVRAVAAGVGSAAAASTLTAVSGWLIVRAAEQPPVFVLLVAIVGVRFFALVRAVLRWAERLAAHDAALRLAARTRVQLWRALVAQGPAADRTPGRALARVVGDVDLLQELSVRVLTPPWVAGLVLTGTAGVLAVLDPAAGLAVAVVLAAAVALVVAVHRVADRGPARRADELRTVTLQETATALEGAADLRAHGLVAATVAELDRGGRHQGVAARRAALARAASTAVAVLASGGAAVLALGVGRSAVATGAISVPALAVLALAPLGLLDPLVNLGAALRQRRAWQDARTRVAAVLAEPVAAEPPAPVALPRPVESLRTADLWAGWPGGPDVLRGLSLSASAGDGWVVVAGPSGSGKSTLLSVLMAALRPRAGSYQLEEVDTAAVHSADVRSAIAWCPQDAHVFAASVRANLALAAPRGQLREPAMRAALTQVGLDRLVDSLPAGLDTPVGSGGTALSGGERRRLAVARALLADREVVLLDEPTAHLDPPTAAALVQDLRLALRGRTVVCVTHQPTVARPGDLLVQLPDRTPPQPVVPQPQQASRPAAPSPAAKVVSSSRSSSSGGTGRLNR